MNFILKENAIFIADSHYNKKNQELKELLLKIENKTLNPSQIFFLGDNFDFLSYQTKYFVNINQELINLINNLSKKYEVVYLEGNHDYNLQKLFPNLKVINRENQPFIIKYENKKIALSHGDNFINWHYSLYCKIIRNGFLLSFLNFIDINNFLSKRIEKALENKNICHDLHYFEELVKKRLQNYSEDIIVEGHYHQGKSYKIGNQEYINIPSLACQKSYTIFKNGEFVNKELN